jgi:putative transcriptional regulator
MRKDLFDELIESVKQMKEIQAGRRKPSRVTRAADLLKDTPDVATLRATFKLSQAKFAALLGISVDTLQNWEQHRRQPEGPAKVLLASPPRIRKHCCQLREPCRSRGRGVRPRRLDWHRAVWRSNLYSAALHDEGSHPAAARLEPNPGCDWNRPSRHTGTRRRDLNPCIDVPTRGANRRSNARADFAIGPSLVAVLRHLADVANANACEQ